MTVADSIAVGEALLTSDIMRYATASIDAQPRSLAMSPRIVARTAGARREER